MTHAAGGSLSNAPWNNISSITYRQKHRFHGADVMNFLRHFHLRYIKTLSYAKHKKQQKIGKRYWQAVISLVIWTSCRKTTDTHMTMKIWHSERCEQSRKKLLTNKATCDIIKKLVKSGCLKVTNTSERSEGREHWKIHSVEIWVKEAVKTVDSKRDYTQPEKEE